MHHWFLVLGLGLLTAACGNCTGNPHGADASSGCGADPCGVCNSGCSTADVCAPDGTWTCLCTCPDSGIGDGGNWADASPAGSADAGQDAGADSGMADAGQCNCPSGEFCSNGTCIIGCSIGGTVYAQSAPNPANGCQYCDPSTTVSGWTNRDGQPCGTQQVCFQGSCQPGCYLWNGPGVPGDLVAPNSISPFNACLICDPSQRVDGYSNLPAGTPCGAGQYCVSNGAGQSDSCRTGCLLDAGFYTPGTYDPQNSCQICGNGTGWTTALFQPPFVAATLPYAPFEVTPLVNDGGLPSAAAWGWTGNCNSGATLPYSLSVLVADGGGSFSAGPTLISTDPVGCLQWWSGRSGDLNGDGLADIAVAFGPSGATTSSVGVWFAQDGGASFSTPAFSALPFAYPGQYGDLALGDFNGDGKPDLAVAGGSNATGLEILLNRGGGGFSDGGIFCGSQQVDTLTAGDFDGDGIADVAGVSYQPRVSTGCTTYLTTCSHTDGGFAAAVQVIPICGYEWAIAAADLNGDGRDDLVLLGNSGNNNWSLQVLLSSGTSFGAPVGYPTITSYFWCWLAVADFTGDGRPDVLVTGGSAGPLFLPNTGTSPWLGPAVGLPTGATAPPAVADFNGDGKLDFAAGSSGNSVVVYLGCQ